MTDDPESVAAWNRAVEDLEWGEVLITAAPRSSKAGREILLTALAAAGVVTLAVLLGHHR